jgi:thiol-disulfide isomerase/thioredoxin
MALGEGRMRNSLVIASAIIATSMPCCVTSQPLGLIGLVSTSSQAQTQDPEKTLKEINDWLFGQYDAARKAGIEPDRLTIGKEASRRACEAVKGLVGSSFPPHQQFALMNLYVMASMPNESMATANSFLASNPRNEEEVSTALMTVVNSALVLKLPEPTLAALSKMTDLSPEVRLSYVEGFARFTWRLALDRLPHDDYLQAIDKVTHLLPSEASISNKKLRTTIPGIAAELVSCRAKGLNEFGRKKEAVECIDHALKQFQTNTGAVAQLNYTRNNLVLVGSPAPNLSVMNKIGSFPGLEALHGKVIVLDFFAHWCIPCIAAFPELKSLYTDFKDKGLEIVGVTSFYGYYKQQNLEKLDMKPSVEFDHLKGFDREYKLPWPVIVGGKTNFSKYGVSAIPQIVIIDKKGIVRRLQVGNRPEQTAFIRKLIDSLLNEPS